MAELSRSPVVLRVRGGKRIKTERFEEESTHEEEIKGAEKRMYEEMLKACKDEVRTQVH